MQDKRCLYCYKELSEKDQEKDAGRFGFHSSCSRKIFGSPIPPELLYTNEDLAKLAEQVVKSQKTITGVQPKLSLGIQKIGSKEITKRLTIVGLFGEYILKPQTEYYPSLPEIEDLTMHLAEISDIKTVPHSLVRLKYGELAYITKRIDRVKGKKIHMEDMCQLTEKLTEHKYKGSYEQVAKAISRYSVNPGLDLVNFYELVLFCFLTGNNDMHLKNFSLLKDKELNYSLSPSYDLVASELVTEGDDEELALSLNGRKKKIKKRDFEFAMKTAGIEEVIINNMFKKFSKLLPKWLLFIEVSFLTTEFKHAFSEMLNKKFTQLEIM